MTVQEFKTSIENDIRRNPNKYINPELSLIHKSHFAALTVEALASQIQITFASDDKIQDYLNGTMAGIEPCCLVCVTLPFGVKQCAVPHNGPCNMCA